MPTINTNDLTGLALDWAVAAACGIDPVLYDAQGGDSWHPSTNWKQGGEIIERECIEFDYDEAAQVYTAANGIHAAQGKTHLIAAMRCFVASRLGDTIDIPEGLK